MTMRWIVFAGAFGAAIGSFLNVCIYRLPLRQSIVRPRSACPHCGRELAWYENLPILSYLVLRGRCRTCRGPISIRYPIVEALTAAMFAGAAWYYGPSVLLVSRLVFGCALIVLFAIDLEHYILPNAITVPGIIVGFLFSLFAEPGWVDSLIGIVVGGGALWLMFEAYRLIRHEEGLGFGDVKMLAMIGAFIGWRLTLMALTAASFLGSALGLALIATGRGNMKSALPFGTFLALGAAFAAVLGPELLAWYLGQFR
jgi:leader peptidase (prepilin peptidase)/N-methyltransferase